MPHLIVNADDFGVDNFILMLRQLPPGVSEVAVHPAAFLDDPQPG